MSGDGDATDAGGEVRDTSADDQPVFGEQATRRPPGSQEPYLLLPPRHSRRQSPPRHQRAARRKPGSLVGPTGEGERWNAFDLLTLSIWTTGNERDGSRLRDTVLTLAAEHQIGVLGAQAPQAGSWYQKLWLRFRSGLGSEEARDVLDKMRLSLEAHLLEEKIAQVDSLKSGSAAALIEAIREQDQAIIVLGQLVIVKDYAKIVVVGVDPSTARAIERSHELSRSPQRVLELLGSVGAIARPDDAMRKDVDDDETA